MKIPQSTIRLLTGRLVVLLYSEVSTMKFNTQNAKIEAITEKTLVLGIDVGSEMHYARAFDYRGIEYTKKPFISCTHYPLFQYLIHRNAHSCGLFAEI